MMMYQCDNDAIDQHSDTPDEDGISNDGCRTGVGIDELNKLCQTVLFSWAPGNEGEALPDGKGVAANAVSEKTPSPQRELRMSIEPSTLSLQPVDGTDLRYYMLLVAYDPVSVADGNVEDDSSGMNLYPATGSFEAVGKLLVGHQISSKMIILPSEDWVVEGICSSDCTGASGISESDVSRVRV